MFRGDEKDVMRMAEKGNVLEKSSNDIKEPFVLEFLGLKEESAYFETKLEIRIMAHL